MGLKDKLGRVIWRRIGRGKAIPIRISNVADKIATESTWTKHRKIVAKLPTGEQIAQMNLRMPDKGKSATIVSVNVEKKFQNKGIGKNLFARATQFLERAGYKFLRAEDLQNPAQVKIRSGYGKYVSYLKEVNGKKIPQSKNRTKYFGDQFGRYGEQKRRITKQDAISYIKQNHTPKGTGRQISATTMIKNLKKLRKK